MNVLFLSQIVPFPPHGGVLQRGYNLIRELGRGARVHLLAFVHPDVLPSEAAVQASLTALHEFCETVEYFPLWAKRSGLHKLAGAGISVLSPRPFSVIAHRSAAFAGRVSAMLRSQAFDIVHVDTLALGQFVADTLPVPMVLTHHNIESVLMGRRAQVETQPLMKAFLKRETTKLRRAELQLSPRFDVNIMMSRQDEQILKDMAPGVETAVVPNGVDTGYFAPDDTTETADLIYTGGMNMFANRDAVMYFVNDIWPAIRARNSEIRFVAVGQDPPAELRAAAASDPRIVVTGYVDDIRPYVRQAAVYVVPLRVGGGTRLKVLDAMAMGKAIVSTSIGCEGIEMEPGRHLLTADTPERFADSVLTLVADRCRRRQLSAEARTMVEHRYAWPVVGRQLFQAYNSAIAHRHRR